MKKIYILILMLMLTFVFIPKADAWRTDTAVDISFSSLIANAGQNAVMTSQYFDSANFEIVYINNTRFELNNNRGVVVIDYEFDGRVELNNNRFKSVFFSDNFQLDSDFPIVSFAIGDYYTYSNVSSSGRVFYLDDTLNDLFASMLRGSEWNYDIANVTLSNPMVRFSLVVFLDLDNTDYDTFMDYQLGQITSNIYFSILNSPDILSRQFDGSRDYLYQQGYQAGDRDGYNRGLLDGKQQGFFEARNFYGKLFEGNYLTAENWGNIRYQQGFDAGSTFNGYDWLIGLFGLFGALFSINLLPGVSIGAVALIPIMITLLPWLIGLFKARGGGKK